MDLTTLIKYVFIGRIAVDASVAGCGTAESAAALEKIGIDGV